MKSRTGILFLFVLLSSLIFWRCSPDPEAQKNQIISLWELTPVVNGKIDNIYPRTGTLFPPEFPPPTFSWTDQDSTNKKWLVLLTSSVGEFKISGITLETHWKPKPIDWDALKKSGLAQDIKLTIIGFQSDKIISSAAETFQISSDSVGAPIFFRAVPLPFAYALKNLEKIRWHLGDVSSTSPPPVLLENLPLCGNCHSFTADGQTMAMDVDYANDKGSYVISEIEPQTVLTTDKIITWCDYRAEDGERTFGLLSQMSPDGRYVVSTVKDRSIFVRKSDLYYSQLFFPIKGILVVYDRVTQKFFSLPGADNPKLVQSNPAWSPDGKFIYFCRTKAYNSAEAEASDEVVLPTEMASEFLEGKRDFKYDICRIPFNNGRGGIATPIPGASANGMSNFFPKISPDGKWLVFAKANNFMLLQPDSRLFIIPVEGGEPREMNCNTSAMNSWHSWSPNGKWLVFSSKLRDAYTDLLLTRITEDGIDSPPVILENLHFSDRAANIPEFVNIKPEQLTALVDNFSNQSYYFLTIGRNKIGEKKFNEALQLFEQALQINPNYGEVYKYKGLTEYLSGQYPKAIESYDRAIELKITEPEIFINKATTHYKLNQFKEALETSSRAIQLAPENSKAYFIHGACQAKLEHYKDALKDFNQSIKLTPPSNEVYYERGVVKALLKDYSSAVSDFQQVVKDDPGEHTAWLKLANCFHKLKKYPKAIETYTQALQVNTQSKDAYFFRGGCLAAMGNYEDALNDYSETIRLAPNFGVAFCQRGLVKMKLGQKASGCEDLQQALHLGFKPAAKEIKKYCK